MYDIRGIKIEIGQKIKFVSHDSGTFRDGEVVGFTNTSVKLLYTYYAGVTPIAVKKDPKFIVVI